jgi:hypothetical protein
LSPSSAYSRYLGISWARHRGFGTISTLAVAVADDVERLVIKYAPRFPLLVDALREDISLAELPDDAWLVTSSGAFTHGEIHRIGWMREVTPRGAQSARAVSVTTEATLFGHEVVVHGAGGQRLTLRVDEEESELRETLACFVGGLIANGARLRDIATATVPISGGDFVQALVDDRDGLRDLCDNYRRLGQDIDNIVDTILSVAAVVRGMVMREVGSADSMKRRARGAPTPKRRGSEPGYINAAPGELLHWSS